MIGWDDPLKFDSQLLRSYDDYSIPVYPWCVVCLEALAERDSELCLSCIYQAERRKRNG